MEIQGKIQQHDDVLDWLLQRKIKITLFSAPIRLAKKVKTTDRKKFSRTVMELSSSDLNKLYLPEEDAFDAIENHCQGDVIVLENYKKSCIQFYNT